MAHVFLSHNSKDKPQAIRLARALERQGVEVWLDSWELEAGELWEPKLREAVCRAGAVLSCMGFHGKGPWQERELAVAVREGKLIRCVRLPGWVDCDFGMNHIQVDDLSGAEWDLGVQKLVSGLRPLCGGRTLRAPSWDNARAPNPYPGLRSFGPRDARWFFGRDDEILRTLQNLLERRWLWLVGNSGSGKSSLAKAGVMAWWATATDQLGVAVDFTPGQHPARELSASLARLLSNGGIRPSLHDQRMVTADPTMAREWIEKCIPCRDPRRWLIVVDQSEELFSDTAHETALNRAIIDSLANLALDDDRNIYVLLTLRADFVPRLLDASYLPRALYVDIHLTVRPLDEDSLGMAIAYPAIMAGGCVEDSVRDLLVQAACSQPDSLPLLQVLLHDLWRKSESHEIKWRDLPEKGVGKILECAIAERARAVDAALQGVSAESVGALFKALTTVTEDGNARRRRASWSSLTPEAQKVAMVLVAERLLVRGYRSNLDERDWLEVAHETVYRAWSVWRAWVDDNAEILRLRRELERDTKRWIASSRSLDLLLRGQNLEEALRVVRDFDDLHEDEYALVSTSEKRRIAEELEAARREAVQADRYFLSRALLVARDHGDIRVRILREIRQLADATVHEALEDLTLPARAILHHGAPVIDLAVSHDAEVVIGLTVDGRLHYWCRDDGYEGRLSFAFPKTPFGDRPRLAFSHWRDAMLIGTGNRLYCLNKDGKSLPRLLAQTPLEVVGMCSFRDSLVLMVYSDGSINGLSLESGQVEQLATGVGDTVLHVVFDGDGSRAVMVSARGYLLWWGHGKKVSLCVGTRVDKEILPGLGMTACFSRDTRSVEVRILGVSSGLEHCTRTFTIDGRLVAFGSSDPFDKKYALLRSSSLRGAKVDLVDSCEMVLHPSNPWLASHRLRGHMQEITGAVISGDGESIATASLDGTIRIWSMDAPPCPIVLSPVFAEQDLHRVGQPVFSADGTRVAYGWRDGTVFVVDAFTGKCEFVIEGRVAGDVVRQIMFSADGRRLAVARAKDGVSVYDGDRGGECAVLKKSRDHLAASMAFLDDDAGLLVVDEGGGLLVWDGEAEDHGWIVSDVHRNLSAVLSRNGRRLAMWVKGQTVIRYLDSERETTVRVLNVEAAIQQVVFSENGRTLVIRTRGRYCWIFDFERDSADGVMCDALDLITSVGVSSDGSVALMGVRSGYCVRYRVDGGRDVLPAISPAAVTSIDVSADGRWAAVASEGGSICVWDLAAVGKPFLLRGHTKSVFSVRFSPDGRLMASGSYDCSIRIWRWSASDRLAQLRANTSDTLTPQERVKYLLEDPEEALVAWRVGEREKGRSGT